MILPEQALSYGFSIERDRNFIRGHGSENKQFDEKPWDAEIVAALIYMHEDQPVLVAQKGGKVTIPETDFIFQFSTTFSAEDFTNFRFKRESTGYK